jgi:hypothetical protein
MIRRLLPFLFAFGLVQPALAAETAVQFGLAAGANPRSVCVYDSSAARNCVPIGSIDASGHSWNALGNLSGATVKAPGATAGVSLAAWAAQTVNVKLVGAKGDGTTDDTAAFATAIASVNTAAASGVATCLYVPPGRYVINGATLPSFSQNTGGGICGAGSWKSVIQLGSAYAGDLFSWSDSWWQGVYSVDGNSVALPQKIGPRVTGLTVLGNRAATAQQNAFVFYDHNDEVVIDDVMVVSLKGRGFYAGALKNDAAAYLRETHISNLKISNSGASGVPAFEITSQCSASCVGEDASNEIDVANVDIYGPFGPGFVLRNAMPSNGGTLRQIRVSKLRVEGTENNPNGVAADLVMIGDPTMSGPVASIRCDACEILSSYANYAALSINGATASTAPAGIVFNGLIARGAGAGYGVKINAGSNIALDLTTLSSTQTNVVIGASPMTGGPIVIDGNGAEGFWTWNVDSSALQYVSNRHGVFGVPTGDSETAFVSAQRPDNTVNFGNARGANAVDMQINRFDPSQVAAAQGSTIAGGVFNTITPYGIFSVISGGNQNAISAFAGVIGGGADNTASGQFVAIPGGYEGNTWNLYGVMVFASGMNSVQGDSELMWGVLRAATTSTSAARLTADGTGTANDQNIWNPPNNSALQFDVSCLYRDTTNGKAQSWKWLGVLMTRGANAAATSISTPAATNGASIGAPGATAPTLAADTTNGGLNISFAAPNNDASHIVCGMSGVVAM